MRETIDHRCELRVVTGDESSEAASELEATVIPVRLPSDGRDLFLRADFLHELLALLRAAGDLLSVGEIDCSRHRFGGLG